MTRSNWWRRLGYWRASARRERELTEEMETHRALLQEHFEQEGMTSREALRAVTQRFGSTLHYREESRGAWIAQCLTDVVADVRYALRGIGRAPGFTAVAVLSAALGIGGCTAIFSIGNLLLETPLPVHQPDRLVTVTGRSVSSGELVAATLSPAERRELNQSAKHSTLGVAGYFPAVQGIFGGSGERVRYWGAICSANYFYVVRPRFVLGGGFDAESDDQPGRPPVVVLSHRLWRTRFQGDPALVGRTVELNGRAVTVKGVVAREFRGTDPATVSDFWIPLSMSADLRFLPPDAMAGFDMSWMLLVARLAEGASIPAAEAEFGAIAARLRSEHAEMPKRTYHLDRAGRQQPVLRSAIATVYGLLLAAAMLVLVIACANIANLLLVRASVRQREFATRLAIGAGRGRLIRQLLTESSVLASLGGGLGVLLCWLVLPALSAVELPIPLPIDLTARFDARVMGFAALVTMLTGLVFGLAPAWRASRQQYASAMKGGALPKAGWLGLRRWRLPDALVVAQVTVAVMLLAAAGLLTRSLQSAARMDGGIGARNLLLVSVDPGLLRYTPERENRFLDELTRRIEALPGVEMVTTTSRPPLSVLGISASASDARRREPGGHVNVNLYAVGPHFFETIEVRMLEGEEMRSPLDSRGPVAVINQAAARKLFGAAGSPIGLAIGGLDREYRVIGVAADFNSSTLGDVTSPAVFLPRNPVQASPALFGTFFLIRTSGEPLEVLPAVRREIQAADSGMAILDAKTWSRHREHALLLPRVAAMIVGVCGITGFLIAVIGLYGVLRYSVERRTREIGIRMALGATVRGVQGMVLRRGAWLSGIGLAIGTALGVAVGRMMQGSLFGVSGTDPLTYALVTGTVALVAAVACWLPARRAARLNPAQTLRCD
ncbi:MAG: ABC transporter permease [Bryobacterales bacterium]|nr:ABC transporter permease [Bryobacterales bacterium]